MRTAVCWTVWSSSGLKWQSDWDPLAPPPGGFGTRLQTSGDVLLHRIIRRRKSQRFLMLAVSKAEAGGAAIVEIHARGKLLRRADVPERRAFTASRSMARRPHSGDCASKAIRYCAAEGRSSSKKAVLTQ